MEDWSELPLDIIDLFVQRLAIKEFIRFSCVCKPWRCAALQKKQRRCFGPWMIFANAENDIPQGDGGVAVRRCYNLSNHESFSLQSPQLQGRRAWGTPYSWLITLGLDSQIQLFNPLTQQAISLPSQPTFKLRSNDIFLKPTRICRWFLKKIAISSNPSDSQHAPVIMVLYGGCQDIAFASPGDNSWTSLKFERSYYLDIIFFKGQFYTINRTGTLSICDCDTAEPKEVPIAYSPDMCCPLNRFYLAEICGDLHLICRLLRSVDGETYREMRHDPRGFFYQYETFISTDDEQYDSEYHMDTTDFMVKKFDFDKSVWIPVEDLYGQALFVGNNTSFAIPASDYPALKPNHIYFTDDYSDIYKKGFCDMGVYDFESKTIIDEPFSSKGRYPISMLSRPFFFMPSHPNPA